jgi:DNA polymerase III alpha subunit
VKMNLNNQMILNDDDVITAWLGNNDVSEAVFTDVEPINIYNDWCNKYDIDDMITALSENKTEGYVDACLQNWYMPDEYKEMDIIEYLLNATEDDIQYRRVLEELTLYKERGMLIVLKFLKHLVDTCNVNGIVLGVGRGSSVASYCLYLLGVHRIDSIKYELDIKEFLK